MKLCKGSLEVSYADEGGPIDEEEMIDLADKVSDEIEMGLNAIRDRLVEKFRDRHLLFLVVT